MKTYVFKIKLKHCKKIWRKVEIQSDQTLHSLAYAILDAFKFDYDHLYSFFMSNKLWDKYSEIAHPDSRSDADDDVYSFLDEIRGTVTPKPKIADEVKLNSLKLVPKQKFLFLYDYGDCWQFEVEFVKEIENANSDIKYPRVIESQGGSPIQYAR